MDAHRVIRVREPERHWVSIRERAERRIIESGVLDQLMGSRSHVKTQRPTYIIR
jgi:hypothetical protein